ncbi:MAG: hypothetical protein IKN04_02115 [Clostridia bacterium]|nr:hypothetical protein [Clostridia bacterium]
MEENERVNEVPAARPEASNEPKSTQKRRWKKKTAPTRTEILNIKKVKRKTIRQNTQQKRRPRREVVTQHDIRYRGPLSYRHMMILGWLCVFLSQVSLVLGLAGQFDSGIAEASKEIVAVGSYAGSLFMPFLLLANFSKILSSKQQFKSLLLTYGGLSTAMGLALPLVYEHYVKGVAATAAQLSPEFEGEILLLFQENVFKDGYLAYNLFIDLFLCTLFMFFLTYHFKRPIWRGWVISFRMLAILPVMYELACIVLKTLCKNGNITLPMYASCFLSTKPPMSFAAFIALALFIKRRERIFLKNGRTYEEYGLFLETNANSLHFSVHACVTFIIAAVLDIMIFIAFSTLMTAGDVMAAGEMAEQVIENKEMLTDMAMRTAFVAQAAGFGESLVLLFVAPFVLLFSYTRKHKDTKMDLFIPVIGIAAIVALYTEAVFRAICELPNILKMYMASIPELDPAALGLTEEDITQLMLLMQTMQ